MTDDLRGINNPMALAKRYLAHRHMLGVRDEADVLSDAIYGIACGVATWREDGGRSLLSWCWLHMDREVGHGRAKRARVMAHEEVADELHDPEWLIARTVDPGYRQIDDRVTLQRWADMAHLTDIQADVIAWMAVHAGTHTKREHFGSQGSDNGLLSVKGANSNLRAGIAKLRRVAATGRPWRHTSTPPAFTTDDVRAAVTG
jgi:hypothetical protein